MSEPSDVENCWVTLFTRIVASHGPNVVEKVTLNKKQFCHFVAARRALQKLTNMIWENKNNRKANLITAISNISDRILNCRKLPRQNLLSNVEHPRNNSQKWTIEHRTTELFHSFREYLYFNQWWRIVVDILSPGKTPGSTPRRSTRRSIALFSFWEAGSLTAAVSPTASCLVMLLILRRCSYEVLDSHCVCVFVFT